MKNLIVTRRGNTGLHLGERVKVLPDTHQGYPATIVKRTQAVMVQSVNRPDQIWLMPPEAVAESGPNAYHLKRLREKLENFLESDKKALRLESNHVKSLLMVMEDYYARIEEEEHA